METHTSNNPVEAESMAGSGGHRQGEAQGGSCRCGGGSGIFGVRVSWVKDQ